MAATGCRDLNVLRELLQENEGDVEATIQALLFIAQTDPTSIFCDVCQQRVGGGVLLTDWPTGGAQRRIYSGGMSHGACILAHPEPFSCF